MIVGFWPYKNTLNILVGLLLAQFFLNTLFKLRAEMSVLYRAVRAGLCVHKTRSSGTYTGSIYSQTVLDCLFLQYSAFFAKTIAIVEYYIQILYM